MRCIVLVLFFVGLLGCEKRPAPPAAESGIVIASIDGKPLLDRDFLAIVELVQDKTPLKLSTHPQKKDLLDQLLNVQLLYEEAAKQNIQDRFEFRAKLADVYVELLLRKARDSVSENDIRAEYLRRPADYDQISARHIFFSLPKGRGSNEEARETKRRRAQQLYEELVGKPEQFPYYARQYSEDQTGRQGGELGFFTRAQMDKDFSNTAFGLKNIGSMSPVIRSDFGYHIIQLTGDRRGFEYHKESIRSAIIQKRQAKIIQDEVARLRANKKIEVFEENLSKLSPLPKMIELDEKKALRPPVADPAEAEPPTK